MTAKRTRKPKAPVAAKTDEIQNSAFGDAFGASGSPFNQFLPQFSDSSGVAETINGMRTLERNIRYFLISNYRQILSWAYVEIGLVQTLVDVPVDDGLRGGVKFKSQQLSEEQIAELQIKMDSEDDLSHAGSAAKWNRLYGGAGVIVMTDQDPQLPINLAAIGPDEKVEFRAADVWELFWTLQDTDYDTTLQLTDHEYFDYYGKSVHKSRVMTLKGLTPPSFIRPRLRGWGFSIVETLIRSLNQYIKGTNLLFEVLDEFKVDVYRFKNLANTLISPNGSLKTKQRIADMNYFKNYQNAVALDSEDEFDHKQLSFAGLAEAMEQIRMQVAAEMRMPMTKLFGLSAAGFNSGEDDIEVYNAMVESQVRRKLKYIILKMAEIRCQQLFGFIPDDLQAEFEPLRVLSSEQQENVKTQKFNRASQSLANGSITLEEYRDICNKGNLFDVMLDNSGAILSDLEDAADEEAAALDGNEDQEPKGAAPKAAGGKAAPKPAKDAKDAKTVKNSAEFDRRAYEAEGGDAWVDPKRKEFFENPGNVDEGLWAKAKAASRAALGEVRWQFVTWWYRKQGGKFA